MNHVTHAHLCVWHDSVVSRRYEAVWVMSHVTHVPLYVWHDSVMCNMTHAHNRRAIHINAPCHRATRSYKSCRNRNESLCGHGHVTERLIPISRVIHVTDVILHMWHVSLTHDTCVVYVACVIYVACVVYVACVIHPVYHTYMSHVSSQIHVTCITNDVYDMIESCVTWLILITRTAPHGSFSLLSHWHDSCMCVTWLSHMWHESRPQSP